MTWGMIAVAGASLVGGAMASSAASDASNAQVSAANQATQSQRDMFNTTVGLEAPYRTAGIDATNKLSYLLGINPTGYSASQSIAPGVSAPATTQYATQVPGAAPGAGSASPYAGMTADQIRVQLAPQFPTSAPGSQEEYQMEGQGLIPASMRAPQTNPALDAAVQQALATQNQGTAGTPTTGIQNVPGMASLGQMTTGGGAARPDPSTDPAFGSLLHNFGTGDFQLDPGIQFQTQQGNLALQNSQAAKDGVLSGSALKDLIGYNQGMAGTGYQSAYDRYMANKGFTLDSLMGVSQQGQAASGNTVNSASGFSNGIANTITGAGNARASGIVGSTNALTGGMSGGANSYLLSNLLNGGGSGGLQAGLSQTGIGSSGFGTGLAYGNQDMGQFF